MDLNQMVVFEAVVREGSFTAAARALGQPKSTVSKRVAELEGRLRVRLLHRSTRRVQPTEEGALYYERCRRVVQEAHAADRLLHDREGAPRGLVRMTAAVAMGGFISPIVTRFLNDYPGVELEVALTDRHVDIVNEGYDLAVRAAAMRDSSLVVRRLGESVRCLVASPAYIESHGTPKRPRDLESHACVIARTGPGRTQWTLERGGKDTVVSVGGRLIASTGALARDGALAGLGIANVPRFLVTDDLARARLIEILPSWPPRRGELHLLYPSAAHLSPRVRALIDMIVGSFARRTG
jgi:DNA-binding transcriptional LysR family regulator